MEAPNSPFVSKHTLIAHKMTVLRDAGTTPADFRSVLKEISFYLGYEVCFTYGVIIVIIILICFVLSGH